VPSMDFKVGDIVEGKVTGVTKFGAFVDLGDNKTGMVHISEVARTFVNDIAEHVKMGDTVRVKVLSIGEDGKISLSIKRALEPAPRSAGNRVGGRGGNTGNVGRRGPRPPVVSAGRPDSYQWNTGSARSDMSFEDMMSKFKQTSEDKFSDLKRKNPDARRAPKRGSSK
jgi:S1 RNA binding domain protein